MSCQPYGVTVSFLAQMPIEGGQIDAPDEDEAVGGQRLGGRGDVAAERRFFTYGYGHQALIVDVDQDEAGAPAFVLGRDVSGRGIRLHALYLIRGGVVFQWGD